MFGKVQAVQCQQIRENKVFGQEHENNVEPTYRPLNGCDPKLAGRIPFLEQMRKTQADERLVYESLKADLESDDPEDHFDYGRRG